MYAWSNIKRLIAGFTVILVAMASLVMSALTAGARADDPYNPGQDVISCTTTSITLTEGSSPYNTRLHDPNPQNTIANILHRSNCTSTLHEKLTLEYASGIVSSQFPQYTHEYGAIWSNKQGEMKIDLTTSKAGQEKGDMLVQLVVGDTDGNSAYGYLVVHLRHYQVPPVTLIDHGREIKVMNKNTKVVDPHALYLHIDVKENPTHRCTWSGTPTYALYPRPSKPRIIRLPEVLWGKSHLLYWIDTYHEAMTVVTSPALKAAYKTC